MGELRAFLIEHRRVAAVIVAFALLMKALLPAGYMVGSTQGQKILTLLSVPMLRAIISLVRFPCRRPARRMAIRHRTMSARSPGMPSRRWAGRTYPDRAGDPVRARAGFAPRRCRALRVRAVLPLPPCGPPAAPDSLIILSDRPGGADDAPRHAGVLLMYEILDRPRGRSGVCDNGAIVVRMRENRSAPLQ
jgi:hypothetical protein